MSDNAKCKVILYLNRLERDNQMAVLLEDNRDKAEYGDFQTPFELAQRVCRWLQAKGIHPDILVEPTFGQGHFLLAALETFPSIKHVYGVEIHEPYFDETQRKIEKFQNDDKRRIHLFCDDVFRFSFSDIAERHAEQFILVLGNPPWVTNSWLGSKDSENVPNKLNIKNVRGIEALTGKGNFDIGESVTLSMLKAFAESKGCFAFLIKNSVVKNIVHAQRQFRFPIACMERVGIDSQKEFNASVDASLFFTKFQEKPGLECSVADSFEEPVKSRFGWYGEKFVANIEQYEQTSFFDGQSSEVWRQGIKHDCSKVMELAFVSGVFRNGFGETVDIENDLVFPLLKSSDLKEPIIETTRKFVLVPQNFVGQETGFIQRDYLKTATYLDKHRELFERRKSSIYRGKPPFSIFGIGDYSFKPYKIAISGLYKQTLFSLVPPHHGKPVMFDDTCYLLGFDEPAEAVCVHYLLNHNKMQDLLNSLVFWEGKRVITKEILMRLDYGKLLSEIPEINILSNSNYHKIAQKQAVEEKFDILRTNFSRRKKP
ncbi:MAG: hypothetical protein FWC50_00945 [Planctomycetaceae bacterium]|nr:hypothetical protein [Planctomycetaceae bacterium]